MAMSTVDLKAAWPTAEQIASFFTGDATAIPSGQATVVPVAKTAPTMLEKAAGAVEQGVCKQCRRPCVGGITPRDCDRSGCAWDRPTSEEVARAVMKAMRVENLIYYVSGRPNASPQDIDWNKRIDFILAGAAAE